MTDTQRLKHTYQMMEDFVGALNDPENFPCLKHGDKFVDVSPPNNEAAAGILLVNDSCILKQYRDNEHGPQGLFPDLMCPTCKLIHYANAAQRELMEHVQVTNLKEAQEPNAAREYMGKVGDQAFEQMKTELAKARTLIKELLDGSPRTLDQYTNLKEAAGKFATGG